MKKLFLLLGFFVITSFSQWVTAQNFLSKVSSRLGKTVGEQTNRIDKMATLIDSTNAKIVQIGELATTPLSISPIEPSVTIRLTADGNIAAWVADNTSYPKTAFFLQTTVTPTVASGITLNNATVDFSDNCVTFSSSKTGEVVRFQLSNALCSNTAQGVTIFQGNGLIRQSGDGINNAFIAVGIGKFPPVTEFSCMCHANGSSSVGCSSGGIGATKCGTGFQRPLGSTSCSVSCGSGYFACCVEH